MGVSIIGKPWNGSPPAPAIAFEFHPRERRNSTARIARTPAIPRASRRTFKDVFIDDFRDTLLHTVSRFASIAKHQTPEKTPNTKLQIPNKLQTPSSKMNAGYHWNLGLEVFLVFGAWSLVFGVWCLAFLSMPRHRRKNIYLTPIRDRVGP